MATRKTKFNFNQAIKKTLVTGATGAVAHVVAEAIDLKDESTMDYAFLGAGIVLPELIKSNEVETAGTALTAIGAYRMAKRYDLAGTLGFNTTPKTSGLPDEYVIGSIGNDWTPAREVYTTEKKNKVATPKNERQSQQATVA